jgi:hypothetical protein
MAYPFFDTKGRPKVQPRHEELPAVGREFFLAVLLKETFSRTAERQEEI